MSELKEHYYYEDRVVTPATHMYRVYHADEADKVIAELKAKLAEKDTEIAELKEQYKDMDVKHTVHIAKMNAWIEKLEENHKREVGQLLMKIAGLEKLVETADKFVKQKGGFTVKDITFNGVKLEGFEKDAK